MYEVFMNYQQIKSFFMWCTLINGCLLVTSVIIGVAGMDFVYAIQGQMFHISRSFFQQSFYCFLGVYKIFWLVCNVIPYLALIIIGKKKS